MVIEHLHISELGYIRNLELSFSKEQVNIIQGQNGSGKTTVLSILYSMLQEEECLQYKSEGRPAVIRLKLEEQGREFSLSKWYRNGNPEIQISSFKEMKELLSIQRDKIFLFHGEWISRWHKVDREMVENGLHLLEELGIEDAYARGVQVKEHRTYELMSGGMQIYYWLLNVFCQVPQNSVILLDEPFALLDESLIKQLLFIMGMIEKKQFILTMNLAAHVPEGCHLQFLDRPGENGGRGEVPRFDYRRIFNENVEIPLKAANREEASKIETPIIKYKLEEMLSETEQRGVEFKEIKGMNPCHSIVDQAEIYINAFLNSQVTGIGVIKWGISDEGRVTGVKLSNKDRDLINRMISERIGQMKPYVSTDSVRISFEAVAWGDEVVSDLWVVEIIVESFASDLLFSTSKNEVYMKTDGGKRRLNSLEIQQELQRRLKTNY